MKILAFIILSCFYYSYYSQRPNVVYSAIIADSSLKGHLLDVQNDSILEIRTYPRHMSASFRIKFRYTRDGRIRIHKRELSSNDSLALIKNGLKQYLNEVTLDIEKRALIDQSNRVVFVRYKDFAKWYYFTYVINQKFYTEKWGTTNSYGLITKSYRENKKIDAWLSKIGKQPDQYEVKVLIGLDAYKKYGYKRVYGVIEITSK